jgi:hypothetical protein
MCLQGASRVAAALARVQVDGLRLLIAWVPMLPPDNAKMGASAAGAFPGAEQYWDGQRTLAAALGRALGIKAKESIGVEGGAGLAWDVYVAYAPGDANILQPRFWMHQLGVRHAPRLDAGEFARRVERLLTP